MDFKTASAETAEKQRLRLADVYVGLNTTASAPTEKDQAEARLRGEHPLSTLAALVNNQRVALLGEPGSGKSTFLNHLAFCLANDYLDRHHNWIERLPEWPKDWEVALPVPITLRDVAAWFQATQPHQRKAGLFQAYLEHWLGEMGMAEFLPALCDHMRDGSRAPAAGWAGRSAAPR